MERAKASLGGWRTLTRCLAARETLERVAELSKERRLLKREKEGVTAFARRLSL